MNNSRQRKNRKRNITWFNPPYNKNLKTNLGKEFLKLLDKNFPKDHVLYKIINRKTVKISYSCTPNMLNKISAHNRKILEENNSEQKETPACNCANACILPNDCRAECVVYKAYTLKPEKQIQYIGCTAGEFKVRYRNHKNSFKNKNKQNETALSQYIWHNKLNRNENEEIIQPDIKWEIAKRCTTYKAGQKSCNLCITEKVLIIQNSINVNNINHRSDLGNRCVHAKSKMLSGIT